MLICKKLDPKAILPTVNHPGEDLAFDLYSIEDINLEPNKVTLVRTGVSARFINDDEPNENYGLLFRDRSSMAKQGITVSGGVIDAGYTDELKVLLTSNYPGVYPIKKGDKIVQMVPTKVLTDTEIKWVDELPESKRKEKGFGSSGR